MKFKNLLLVLGLCSVTAPAMASRGFAGVLLGANSSFDDLGSGLFTYGLEGAYHLSPEFSVGIYALRNSFDLLGRKAWLLEYGAKGRYHFEKVPGLSAGVFVAGTQTFVNNDKNSAFGGNSGDWGVVAGYDHVLTSEISVGAEIMVGDLGDRLSYFGNLKYNF
ncbi:MAG: outer membrane beta-barrel protein [Bdellovibrionota bacterium]